MGTTTISAKFCRVDKPDVCMTVNNMIVDTGAVVSAIPATVAKELGVQFPVEREFRLADGSVSKQRVGSIAIEIDGRKGFTEVIALKKGKPLVGVTALEALGFTVNPKTGLLVKNDAALLL